MSEGSVKLGLPSYPWDSKVEPQASEDFTCAGDLVQQITSFRYNVDATPIIFSSIITDETAILADCVPLNYDNAFAKQIRAVSALSANYLDSMVTSLNFWRRTMNPFAELHSPDAKQASGQTTVRKGLPEMSQDERQSLVVDYIYTETMVRVLCHYNGDNLSENPISDLEDICFKFLITTPVNPKAVAAVKNREHVRNLFKQVLGHAARFRVKSILAKFYKYYTLYGKSPQTQLLLLDGVSEVFLNYERKDQCEGALESLKALHDNFKPWLLKAKKTELKAGLADFLARLYQPLASCPQEWITGGANTLVLQLIALLESNTKKGKNPYLAPLLVSLVNATSRDFFWSKFDLFLSMILTFPKDSATRTGMLEALFSLLYASTTKYSKPGDDMESVTATLAVKMYPLGKKAAPMGLDSEQLDIMVDVVGLLATRSLKCLSAIVKPLVEATNNPEATLFGLQSFMRIYYQLNDDVEANTPPVLASCATSAKAAYRKSVSRQLREKADDDDVEMPTDVVELVSSQAGNAIATHRVYAQTLSRTSAPLAVSSLPRDKLILLHVLETAVDSLQVCMPPTVPVMQLLAYVSSFTVHQLSGLAAVSQNVLKQIMAYKADYRLAVSIAYCKFALNLPAVDDADLTRDVANLAVNLHRIWFHELTHKTNEPLIPYPFENMPEESNYDFSEIEALAVIFMCSEFCAVRTQGLELLQIAKVTAECYPDAVHFDLYTVVLSQGPLIIKESSELPFELAAGSSQTKVLTPHLADILKEEADSVEKILRWSRIIGGLLLKGSGQATDTIKSVWKALEKKLIPVQRRFDQVKPNSPFYLGHLQLWCNYLAAATGSSAVHDANIFEATSADVSVVSSSRDLIRILLPLVRHEDKIKREVGENALSFMPSLVVSTMVTECAPYERQAFDEKVKAKKHGLTTPVMLSYAYRIITRNKHDGYLFDENNALKHHLSYLCSQIDKVPAVVTASDVRTIHFWRYNVCLTIANVFAEIAKKQGKRLREHVAPSTYEKIFAFVVKCSGYSDSAKDVTDYYSSVRKANDDIVVATPSDEKSVVSASLCSQLDAVRYAALLAMAELFHGPCDIGEEEQSRKFHWVSAAFADQQRASSAAMKRLGQDALVNLLRTNTEKKAALFSFVVSNCYSCDTGVQASNWFFMTVVRLYLAGRLPLYPEVLLLLGLHKLGSSDKVVAQNGVLLLQELCRHKFPGEYPFVFYAKSYQSRISCQRAIADQIADNFGDTITQPLIEQAFYRYHSVEEAERGRLLVILEPFLAKLKLQSSKISADKTIALLERLAVLTMVGDAGRHQEETSRLWSALATNKHNVIMIMNFFVSLTVNTRNSSAINAGCNVALLLAQRMPSETCNKLVNELPSIEKDGAVMTQEEFDAQFLKSVEEMATMAKGWGQDTKQLFGPMLRHKPLSRSNVALIFLSEIILSHYKFVQPHLHIILLQAILAVDSSNETIREYAKSILANVLFKAIDTPKFEESLGFIRTLAEPKLFGNESFWQKGEHICKTGELPGRSDPVRSFLLSFTRLMGCDDLRSNIAVLAVRQAASCKNEHYKCRMMQIFRILRQPLSVDVLYYLLTIIKDHFEVRDTSTTNRSVMFEAILALQSAAEATWSTQVGLDEVPTLWWGVVACLHSDNQREYALAADLLAVILQNIDFDNKEVQDLFSSQPPGKWQVPFRGVQSLLLKGLTSQATEAVPKTLLTEFMTLPWGAVLDSTDARYMENTLAMLPWLLQDNTDDASAAAIHLATNMMNTCTQLGFNDVASVFRNFAQGEYASPYDFMDELAGPYTKRFLIGSELYALNLLLAIIRYGNEDVRASTLHVCKSIFLAIDSAAPDMKEKANPIINQFCALLQTSEWREAIEVMDAIVKGSIAADLDKFSFMMFPNPSVISKTLDRYDGPKDPWQGCDENQKTILAILSDLLNRMGDPSSFETYNSIADPEYSETFPLLPPGAIHCDVAPKDVIRVEKPLVFKEDTDVPDSKAAEAARGMRRESSVIVNALLDSDALVRAPPLPSYSAPPPPIVIPPPSLVTPAIAAGSAPLFSPRRR